MNISKWLFQSSLVFGAKYFYRQFVKDTKRAGEVNRAVLKEMLTANANTLYGQRYNFANIKDSKQYKAMVPLTSYSDYEQYIERVANGEENVLTAEGVKYFGLSSGTTGKQKYIPMTGRGQKVINMNMMFLQQGMLFEALPKARFSGKGCLIMNMVQAGKTPAGIPTGSGTSGGVQSMQKMMEYFWTSPLEVLGIQNQQDANYLHLLFALRERKLAYVGAPFPSSIVQLFTVLEDRWQEIVEDLAGGRISQSLNLAPELREKLTVRLSPEPQRAEELKREFAKGFKGIAPRVWPKMVYVSCVIGGSFNIYVERLKYYTQGLPIYSAIYGATEALIGVGHKLDAVSYTVTPRPAYYEFIPSEASDQPQPTTYDLDELEVGKSYEVVITNFSGFYRYRVGDVVKVVGHFNKTPLIEFMYRRGQLLNLAGEKTPEPAVQHAVKEAMRACGAVVEDYTVTQNLEGPLGYYQFYIEAKEPEQLKGRFEEVRNALEKGLEEANPRYLAGLRAKRIDSLTLKLVREGTFQALRQELVKRGASLNQVKIPRLIKDEKLISLLERNIV